HDRTDGQINAAGDDDHRHAQCGDADDDRLPRDEFQVGGPEELRTDQRAEKGEHDRQAKEDTRLLGKAAPAYDARAPDASINNECSFHSSTPRTGPSRPRAITAIRSHTPSSSGK